MDTYKILINFKDGKELLIDIESNENLRDAIARKWRGKQGALYIGEYLVSVEDIRWIQIKGEKLEKPSR